MIEYDKGVTSKKGTFIYVFLSSIFSLSSH